MFENIPWREVLLTFGIVAALSLAGAIALLMVAARQIAEINIPEDADFFETLQHVPITVPLALDLLDMAFDIFAAPISWIILELLGLQALQLVTAFEGFIPGTQLIPTLTAAWAFARMMRKKEPTQMRDSLHSYQQMQRQQRYGELGKGSSTANYYRQKALSAGEDFVEGEYYEEDFDEPEPEYFDEDY